LAKLHRPAQKRQQRPHQCQGFWQRHGQQRAEALAKARRKHRVECTTQYTPKDQGIACEHAWPPEICADDQAGTGASHGGQQQKLGRQSLAQHQPQHHKTGHQLGDEQHESSS
jgi:hypothetical protein